MPLQQTDCGEKLCIIVDQIVLSFSLLTQNATDAY